MPIVTTSGLIPNAAPASGLVVIQWAAAAGTSDAITAAYSTPNTALTDGLILAFRASAANATTTPSFSPDGLTAHVITRFGGAALVPGDIPGALAECLVRYNLANTRWELLNPAGNDMIGAGLNQQLLTSQGAGVNAAWTNPSRQLLNTLTASNSATLSDTTSLTDARFNVFELEFEGLVPATNAVNAQLQVHSNGAFQNASYLANVATITSTTVAAAAQTANVALSSAADVSNGQAGLSGTLKIWAPQGTTSKKLMKWHTAYINTTPGAEVVIGGGCWNGGNTAIDGFQVLMSSGNITSGQVRVYGLS